MSRRHCEVETVERRLRLRDLGSSNGTFVNGIPMRERSSSTAIASVSAIGAAVPRSPGRHHVRFDGEALTEGAVDDRTTRVAATASGSGRDTRFEPESPGAIMAEVLAGRVTLQAHDMVGESAPMRAVYERIRKVAPIRLHGAGARRDRHRQGARRPGDPPEQPAARGPVRRRQLRRARPRRCSRASSSVTRSGAFTGAVALQERACSRSPTAARCSSTRSASSRRRCRPSCCACCRSTRFERVGGTRDIKVDVRVIAATNRDLEAARSPGASAQDLCYRLNVVTDHDAAAARTPRRHPAAAPRYFARQRTASGTRVEFSREAIDALSAYQWPGNVRELENAIERALVLGCNGRIVADDLPEATSDASPACRRRGRGFPSDRARNQAAADPRSDRSHRRQLHRRGEAPRHQSRPTCIVCSAISS